MKRTLSVGVVEVRLAERDEGIRRQNCVALWKVSERTSAPKAAPEGNDQHAAAPAKLSDDRHAGAVDAECGDVQAQDPLVCCRQGTRDA